MKPSVAATTIAFDGAFRRLVAASPIACPEPVPG